MAWDEDRFSFRGRHYTYEDVSVTPKPFGPLPLVLGGSVPAAAARAGRIADGFLAGPQSDLTAFRTLVDAFDESAIDSDRDPTRMFLGFEAVTWVSEDGSVPEPVWQAIWHKLGCRAGFTQTNRFRERPTRHPSMKTCSVSGLSPGRRVRSSTGFARGWRLSRSRAPHPLPHDAARVEG